MHILNWILLMTFLNGLIALVGIISFLISSKDLKKITIFSVAFATGALLGGAFFHFLPESIEELSLINITILTFAGIIL